ncbi:MAG: hypothetical protein ACI9JN_002655 [Bacteroidia bacterium]|jgi:hypothetical protein
MFWYLLWLDIFRDNMDNPIFFLYFYPVQLRIIIMKKYILYTVACFSLILHACGSDDGPSTKRVEMQFHGYTDGGNSTFRGTETKGEEVAVTLDGVAGSYQITNIQCLFGGTGNTPASRDVVLKIYKDNGDASPGEMIHTSTHTLASSLTAFSDLNIKSSAVRLAAGQDVRVSFEILDTKNFPSFAEEFDGAYDESKNWLKDADGTWNSNDGVGINGNWVIRAIAQQDI